MDWGQVGRTIEDPGVHLVATTSSIRWMDGATGIHEGWVPQLFRCTDVTSGDTRLMNVLPLIFLNTLYK